MSTREVTLSAAEIQRIRTWADVEWHKLDQERMHTVPASPQEAAILADQLELQLLQEKLVRR